jgi:hypothetical protein
VNVLSNEVLKPIKLLTKININKAIETGHEAVVKLLLVTSMSTLQ